MAFVNYKGGVSTTTTRMGYLIVVWAVKNHTRAKPGVPSINGKRIQKVYNSKHKKLT